MHKNNSLATEILRDLKRKNEVLCGAVALLLAAVFILLGKVNKK